MKLIITEEQLRLIIESEKRGKLMLIDLDVFPIGDNDEEKLEKIEEIFLKFKSNKGWTGINIIGDLFLVDDRIGRLENFKVIDGDLGIYGNGEFNSLSGVEYVMGDLKLNRHITIINDLQYVGGNLVTFPFLKKLDSLKYVGGNLDLDFCDISNLSSLKYIGGNLKIEECPIESLPNGLYVGGFLNLRNTPLSKTTTEEELRNKIEVKGDILL